MSSQRIERCFTDNIYLIESLEPEDDYERKYLIMGNSGRTYTVKIANYPTCTCPDFRTRGNRCKHIYFVLMRIMNISNYMEYEYSDDELEEMFLNIPPVAKNLLYEDEQTEQKEVNQKFAKGDICPICLDPLENGKELDYCKYSCGKTVHKKCFSMWEKSKGGICVFCRGKWYSNSQVNKPKKVSMHPIGENQINDLNNDIEMEGNDSDNDYDNKIQIDEDEMSEENNKKRNKKKKRNKSKSRSRNRSRKKSLSKSKSRSRSRDKSRKKNKNKIRYPKE